MQTTWLHESFEGSNSSLACSDGELSKWRQWETQYIFCMFWFWGQMFFLGHNFGSRHARRSSKGSIDAGDRVVSKNSLRQNFGLWDWRPGPVKVGQKTENTRTLRAHPRRTPHPNKKIFFNRTKKTFRIRRGFEHLCSCSGWRVITKKTWATIVALVVVNDSFQERAWSHCFILKLKSHLSKVLIINKWHN